MTTGIQHPRCTALFAFTLCLVFSVVAAADDAGKEVSVGERTKAAEAYDQGTSAYLSERYELAAHWFERAYRLVPTSTALTQAVRAHYKADNAVRAANLALRLRAEYASDPTSKQVADEVIASVKPLNVLVKTQCDRECTLELDGALMDQPTFFVTPGVMHAVKAGFDTGETSTEVRGSAGELKKVRFMAPTPPPPPPVPRSVFFSSLGATLALGAVTIWSGIDANRGVDAFESAARNANSPGINNNSSPTPAQEAQSLLDEGRKKERRTNILIGVTAGMAAGTAVLGVFTNWKKESREPSAKRIEPVIGVSHKGGGLTLKGRF
jgi:hypothetical protein